METCSNSSQVTEYLKSHYPNHRYSYKNQTQMGSKSYYNCSLSKYKTNPHCRHTLMIFYLSETHIQIHENEIEHSFHNRIIVEGIEDREKSFFELNCGLIRFNLPNQIFP